MNLDDQAKALAFDELYEELVPNDDIVSVDTKAKMIRQIIGALAVQECDCTDETERAKTAKALLRGAPAPQPTPDAALREALRRFVDHETDPCRFDHHGYCQEHPGAQREGQGCAVADGRALLAGTPPADTPVGALRRVLHVERNALLDLADHNEEHDARRLGQLDGALHHLDRLEMALGGAAPATPDAALREALAKLAVDVAAMAGPPPPPPWRSPTRDQFMEIHDRIAALADTPPGKGPADVPSHGQLVRESLGNPARCVYVGGEGWVSSARVCELADGIRRGDPYPWHDVTDDGELLTSVSNATADGPPGKAPDGTAERNAKRLEFWESNELEVREALASVGVDWEDFENTADAIRSLASLSDATRPPDGTEGEQVDHERGLIADAVDAWAKLGASSPLTWPDRIRRGDYHGFCRDRDESDANEPYDGWPVLAGETRAAPPTVPGEPPLDGACDERARDEVRRKWAAGESVPGAGVRHHGTRSDGKWGCDACCNGDRCDDATHVDRSKCKACNGSGAVPDALLVAPSTPPRTPTVPGEPAKCGARDWFSPRRCDRPAGHEGEHDDSRYPVDHDWSTTHGPNRAAPPTVPGEPPTEAEGAKSCKVYDCAWRGEQLRFLMSTCIRLAAAVDGKVQGGGVLDMIDNVVAHVHKLKAAAPPTPPLSTAVPGEPPRDMLGLLFDARAALDKLPSTDENAHSAWRAVQECISRCTSAAPPTPPLSTAVPGEPPPRKQNACMYCGTELGKSHPFTCCDACWPRFPMGSPPLFRRDGRPTGNGIESRCAPPTPPRPPVDEAAVRADERRATERDIADTLERAGYVTYANIVRRREYDRTPAPTPEEPSDGR